MITTDYTKPAIDSRYLGGQIRKCRLEKNLTQECLAGLADLSPAHISRIETGAKRPGVEVLVKIAWALDVTVDRLLTGNQKDSNAFFPDVWALLADCSQQERSIILEIAEAAKNSIRRYT